MKIIESIKAKITFKDSTKKLEARSVDADDVDALVKFLIKEVQPILVINAGPCKHGDHGSVLPIESLISVGYIGSGWPMFWRQATSTMFTIGSGLPWEVLPLAGITGILGAGFDPGVVSSILQGVRG